MSFRHAPLALFFLAAAACGETNPEPNQPTGDTPSGPPPEIVWAALPTDNAPLPRFSHTAVWTGSKMIVWGGESGSPTAASNTGGLYDPKTRTWAQMSMTNAPAARYSHTAVWTGSKMLVWGGFGAMNPEPAGGIYDPATDTWTPMSTQGQPTPRYAHTAVWTGSKMVIWGGASGPSVLGNGGIYDPATDTWTVVNAAGGPPPRRFHGAAWSGTQMMVWGGTNAFDWLNDGAFFDPAGTPTGVWIRATNSSGAPPVRERPTTAFTGKSFLVWGGWTGGDNTNTGGLLDAASNTWTATSGEGAPEARVDHVGVWAGNHLVVWGGCRENMCSATNTLSDGGQFVPSADGGTWYPIKGQPELDARFGATAVYTGDAVIVWGGRLDPATPTNTGAEAPL